MDARSMRGQNESSEPAGATAAAVAPAGSLDSFCPLIDLASIISDSRRDKAARHAEKPYPARKVQDLPGCYVSGGRGESHPPAPTDPGLRGAPHRALVILSLRNRRTTPTGRKASGTDGLSAASTPWPSGTPAAVDTSCGANASSLSLIHI